MVRNARGELCQLGNAVSGAGFNSRGTSNPLYRCQSPYPSAPLLEQMGQAAPFQPLGGYDHFRNRHGGGFSNLAKLAYGDGPWWMDWRSYFSQPSRNGRAVQYSLHPGYHCLFDLYLGRLLSGSFHADRSKRSCGRHGRCRACLGLYSHWPGSYGGISGQSFPKVI